MTQLPDFPCAAAWVPALKQVLERFRPTFLLFGATRLAQELAPPLCLHLKGVYVPDCSISVTPQLKVEWFHPRSRSITEFFEEDLEASLVALVRPDFPGVPAAQAAEIEVVLEQAPAFNALKNFEISHQEPIWGADVSVVLGSLALHRADELAAWCQKQEFPLIRLGQAPESAIPWWRAEPAGSGLLLAGCTAEEFTLCEDVFALFSRWVCIGCADVNVESLRENVQIVSGNLDDLLNELFQKEL